MSGVEVVFAAAGSRYLWELVKAIFRSPFKTTIFASKFATPVEAPAADRLEDLWLETSQHTELFQHRDWDAEPRFQQRESHVLHMEIKKGPAPRAKGRTAPPVATHFKLVFLSVLALTVLSVIAAGLISSFNPELNPNQQKVFDALMWAFTTGCGAILGLLGGKSLR